MQNYNIANLTIGVTLCSPELALIIWRIILSSESNRYILSPRTIANDFCMPNTFVIINFISVHLSTASHPPPPRCLPTLSFFLTSIYFAIFYRHHHHSQSKIHLIYFFHYDRSIFIYFCPYSASTIHWCSLPFLQPTTKRRYLIPMRDFPRNPNSNCLITYSIRISLFPNSPVLCLSLSLGCCI